MPLLIMVSSLIKSYFSIFETDVFVFGLQKCCLDQVLQQCHQS